MTTNFRRPTTTPLFTRESQIKLFLLSVACLFTLTGVLKILGASQEAPFLSGDDPVLSFLTNRQIMITVGMLELGLAAVILTHRSSQLKLWLTLWIACLFAIWRVGLVLTGSHRVCPCLGGTLAWALRHGAVVDWALKVIIGYLAAVSTIFLMLTNRSNSYRALPSRGSKVGAQCHKTSRKQQSLNQTLENT